jgi:regulator of cell morphogenesis and NO signaling
MEAQSGKSVSQVTERAIGDIVAADYRAAGVFEKHGIDFCCGGQIPLSEASREKGLDPTALLAEIDAAMKSPIDRSRNFVAWESPFLADYIINTHHSWLRENDPAIVSYTTKIASVHGRNHPELAEIARIFAKIASDMTGHLREEEEVLFPAIRRIDASRKAGSAPTAADQATMAASLATLGRDHEEIGGATHEIRRLAAGYALPADACTTYALTYAKLAEFEEDLHQHVHLENNILFPRAAALGV